MSSPLGNAGRSSAGSVTFEDAAEKYFEHVFQASFLNHTMDTTVSSALDPIIKTAAIGCKPGKVLEPRIASEVLLKASSRVEQRLISWAQAYSPLRWLWMLRRLPNIVFSGPLSTNLGYDLGLAEVITGGSGARETPNLTEDFNVWYGFDAQVPARLARLCCGVKVLSHLHSMSRWVGKGVSLRFTRKARFQPLATKESQQAISLYDERVAKRRTPPGRFGSIISEPWRGSSAFNIVRVDRSAPHERDVRDSGGEGTISARYVAHAWDIASLQVLLNDDRLKSTPIITEDAALCLLLMRIANTYIRSHKQGWRGVSQRGYLLSDRHLLAKEAQPVLTSNDPVAEMLPRSAIPGGADELVSRATAATGKTWPVVPGPLMRADGDVLCVDLASATSRLDKVLLFPAHLSGGSANARGDHFEIVVQNAIDRTRGRPSDIIRALRGRDLRFNGAKVTDLDAIATIGTTLLAVSCKGIADPGNYETGAYNTIRNAAQKVEEAVRDWAERLQFLREHRRGDNYDLSEFAELLGVVCTPHVLFVPMGIATEEVSRGLRSACTLEELQQWLLRDHDQ